MQMIWINTWSFFKGSAHLHLGCFAYRKKRARVVVIYAFLKIVIVRVGVHLRFFFLNYYG